MKMAFTLGLGTMDRWGSWRWMEDKGGGGGGGGEWVFLRTQQSYLGSVYHLVR